MSPEEFLETSFNVWTSVLEWQILQQLSELALIAADIFPIVMRDILSINLTMFDINNIERFVKFVCVEWSV